MFETAHLIIKHKVKKKKKGRRIFFVRNQKIIFYITNRIWKEVKAHKKRKIQKYTTRKNWKVLY